MIRSYQQYSSALNQSLISAIKYSSALTLPLAVDIIAHDCYLFSLCSCMVYAFVLVCPCIYYTAPGASSLLLHNGMFDANRPISELQTSSITVTIKRPTENRLIKAIKISMFMNVSTEKFVVDKVFINLSKQNTSCVICNTHFCKIAFSIAPWKRIV